MSRRELLGLGAVACVACCIGPILAVLGAITALGVGATILFGAAALLITAAVAGLAVVMVRRRRRSCMPRSGTVAVDLARTRS